jgi:hypothetical protein
MGMKEIRGFFRVTSSCIRDEKRGGWSYTQFYSSLEVFTFLYDFCLVVEIASGMDGWDLLMQNQYKR